MFFNVCVHEPLRWVGRELLEDKGIFFNLATIPFFSDSACIGWTCMSGPSYDTHYASIVFSIIMIHVTTVRNKFRITWNNWYGLDFKN